jgi:hypothetical protein
MRGDDKMRILIAVAVGVVMLSGCRPIPTPPPDPEAELIEKGRQIFFNETFNGNGRTCGTCHPTSNNLTIDPAFIATLPDDDPLFVAEFNPDLATLERPELMRKFGLILENLDGFDDLENKFVLRGVPHVLAMRNSIDSPQGPRTGWSGDGAPGDGSLRAFATGAVIQHFPKTLNRVPGVDFRLPTEEELDALEAFQLSLGRQEDLTLPLLLKDVVPRRGQEIFLDGANARLGDLDLGNANFDTGVEDLPDQPQDLTGELVPPDDGFGTPGDRTFNTPVLVETADTGPFFHNNSIETIEGAVAFFNGDAFNNSPAGLFLANLDPNGVGINLDGTQVVAVAAFLRVINALENIRQSIGFLQTVEQGAFRNRAEATELLERALNETDDSIMVLSGGGLNPDAVADLRKARRLTKKARWRVFLRRKYAREAIVELESARDRLVETS